MPFFEKWHFFLFFFFILHRISQNMILTMKLILSSLLFTALCSTQFLTAQVIEKGRATYYANKFVGRKTANGEVYTHNEFTAAHRTIPLGTHIRVTRTDNQKSITVKVNDRCADHAGGIIDLSKGAAEELGFLRAGVTNVKLELIDEGLSPEEMASAKYNLKVSQAPEMEQLMPAITTLNEQGFVNQTILFFSQSTPPHYELFIGPYKHKQNAQLVKMALMREGLTQTEVVEKENM